MLNHACLLEYQVLISLPVIVITIVFLYRESKRYRERWSLSTLVVSVAIIIVSYLYHMRRTFRVLYLIGKGIKRLGECRELERRRGSEGSEGRGLWLEAREAFIETSLPYILNIDPHALPIFHSRPKLFHPYYPTIYLANYPAQRISYLAHLLIPNVCIVSMESGEGFLSLIHDRESMILLKSGKGRYEELRECIKRRIGEGKNIFLYVNDNKTRKSEYHLGTLRRGAFYIAKELGLSVRALAISYLEPFLGGLSERKRLRVEIGERIWVKEKGVRKSISEVRRFLSGWLRRWEREERL